MGSLASSFQTLLRGWFPSPSCLICPPLCKMATSQGKSLKGLSFSLSVFEVCIKIRQMAFLRELPEKIAMGVLTHARGDARGNVLD